MRMSNNCKIRREKREMQKKFSIIEFENSEIEPKAPLNI